MLGGDGRARRSVAVRSGAEEPGNVSTSSTSVQFPVCHGNPKLVLSVLHGERPNKLATALKDCAVDVEQSRAHKGARQSVNLLLQAYYAHWLRRFDEDNERFFEQMMRFAEGKQEGSPQTAPAE